MQRSGSKQKSHQFCFTSLLSSLFDLRQLRFIPSRHPNKRAKNLVLRSALETSLKSEKRKLYDMLLLCITIKSEKI